MAQETPQKSTVKGFAGSVAGLHLSDVLQLNGHNRFSGCVTVEYGAEQGMIFFRDGEVIHAEQGRATGATAFYAIISWPGGLFTIQPKVTTTSRTIGESLNYLLLEAHRLMDEAQAGRQSSTPERSERQLPSIAERAFEVPGVTYAVVTDKSGVPQQDDSFEAESLARQGVTLARLGDSMGELFGLGALKSTAWQGKNYQLLMFEARNLYLSVAVRGTSQLGQVEADLRTALTAKK
jgi:predicted regulator of Ras-like GTPase activity (Roadblock/LC7/MglB family)